MPHRGEVSVFRVDGLTTLRIWEIGGEISASRHRPLYARGDTAAHNVRRIGLEVMSAEPPVHHANIVGWPDNDKPRQKLIALQLAAVATLVPKD